MADSNLRPPQQQEPPGKMKAMDPPPETRPRHPGSGKLDGQVAIVTGGDSGIGRAVAEAFANEGADVCIVYKQSHEDADATRKLIEGYGRKCLAIAGDVRDSKFCTEVVERTVNELGSLQVLVNNAGEQHPQEGGLEDISDTQLEDTFRTNIFGYFYMARAALKHMGEGSAIVNTASVTAYKGHAILIDYAATKGAVVSFTRSLAATLAKKNIRVNCVAPGPIWTPLIPSTFKAEKVAKFGSETPLGRAGQPNEVAPSFVFLASDDASYITGHTLHPNGGTPVGS